MWRKALSSSLLFHRTFSSSSTTEIPTLYSFLQPTVFALKPNQPPNETQDSQTKTLTQDQKTTLETTLQQSLLTQNTDEAWKSFKALTSNSIFPNKPLTNSLITHLSSLKDTHNLKRAFASVVFVIEKDPKLLSFETVTTLLSSMNFANTAAPAFALIKCMFKNSDQTYCEVVKGYLQNGVIKSLASLIIEAQNLESSLVEVDKSIGYGIISGCINLGLSDKAHSILDEMNAQGGSVGLGVYVPILKAYCKEHRTAEATQLVMDISNAGLQLDSGMYDALIEASMTSQDFQSAFTLFRDMRDARIPDLKGSYLTVMTGLMENQRPELMAAYLDEVVEDPRIEVKTHDWNSIIHAFCKAGRLEDARRTFRRMTFLQFEPNDQTYLSMINGFVTAEQYFSVLMLWNEVKRKISSDGQKGIKFDHTLVDAFLYALVKGGFFDAVMQVVEKSQEMRIFVDKWRYKQAFMEKHKKLKVSKLRKRSFRKMEALIAFKNWAGLNA
ncbi:hypothetical protein COLO4_27885 [Corchorus olitorius]|uniref:At1g68980-like TPR repeats domain-containing protein n=1 Tax=Corchorus olitorius TaxID=93759 RepID=A0A1R3HP26_9ROSI|nr:hypothetical protein COLO4_27885 [Corchorus olitorius]